MAPLLNTSDTPNPEMFDKPDPLRRGTGRLVRQRSRTGHISDHCPDLAAGFTHQISRDFQDRLLPPEIQRLDRTIARWASQIVAWHHSAVTNGPTEALNNLIKRIKRTAFGSRNFRQLPNQSIALRRETQLGASHHHHSPVNPKRPTPTTDRGFHCCRACLRGHP